MSLDVVAPGGERGDTGRHRSLPMAAIPARPECVIEARRHVVAAASEVGLHPDRIDDLAVAVSEACTNAIEAQLAAGVAEPIQLWCRVDGHEFVVRLVDRGPGFDPLAVPVRPPLTDPSHLGQERGWGIQLMRSLVDTLAYETSDAGTSVRLVVSLEPDERA